MPAGDQRAFMSISLILEGAFEKAPSLLLIQQL